MTIFQCDWSPILDYSVGNLPEKVCEHFFASDPQRSSAFQGGQMRVNGIYIMIIKHRGECCVNMCQHSQ